MRTHQNARAIINALEMDEEARRALLSYVSEQETPSSWDNETTAQCASRAANRAIEAISRVGTLTTDLAELRATVEHQRELIDMLVRIVTDA